MGSLTTYITDIKYQTPTGWSVIETPAGTVTGTINNSFGRGTSIECSGETEHNPRYGAQFKARSIKEVPPQDNRALMRFVNWKCQVPSILARKIEQNGWTSQDVLNHLAEFHPHGEKIEKQLNRLYRVGTSLADCLAFAEGTGVRHSAIEALVTAWELDEQGDALGPPMDILTQDPYAMIGRISGIGFQGADNLAQKAGLEPDCPQRLRAALIHTVSEIESTGNTCLHKSTVFANAGLLLGDEHMDFEDELSECIMRGLIKQKQGKVAEPSIFEAEKFIAQRIVQMCDSDWDVNASCPGGHMQPARKPDWLSEDQSSAIDILTAEQMSVLTGGPGTGKTTISRILVDWAARNDKYIGLCAPTGRAAARMQELIGSEAFTIHRMLHWRWDNPKNRWGFPFSYHEGMKLPYDFVLVDESSMIDARLFCSLIEALHDEAQLILVGDADQIPSVGAGEVFQGLCDSNIVPVAWLTNIHRQAENSLIPDVCRAVNTRGEYIVGDGGVQGGDMFHIEVKPSVAVVNSVIKLFTKLLPEQRGFDPIKDIYVLSARRRLGDSKCLVSTDVMNPAIQNTMMNGGFALSGDDKDTKGFRLGDRVINTKNEYKLEVWNGDIGVITRESEMPGETVVMFQSGKEVSIKVANLELAYAISVHKAQGGEFPCVIMAVHEDQGSLLNKKLIYTGISRATKMCVIVGTRAAMDGACRRGEKGRHTLLGKMIEDAVEASDANV